MKKYFIFILLVICSVINIQAIAQATSGDNEGVYVHSVHVKLVGIENGKAIGYILEHDHFAPIEGGIAAIVLNGGVPPIDWVSAVCIKKYNKDGSLRKEVYRYDKV